MAKRLKRLLAALSISLVLIHSSQLPLIAGSGTTPNGKVRPESVKNASSQLNDFSLRVLKELLQQKRRSDENVVISPIGLAACTAVLASGAKGKTHEELRYALSPEGSFSATDCSEVYKVITRPVPKVDVTFASSIYGPGNVTFDSSFEERFRTSFDGTMQTASTAERLREQVIGWVKTRTHDMIVLSPQDIEPSKIGIINVLYFKGLWADQFKPASTKTEEFVKSDSSSMTVDMMHKDFACPVLYVEQDGSQIIKLPYLTESPRSESPQSESPFSMYIILPKSGQQPDNMLSELTAKKLDDKIGAMRHKQGSLALPRFTISVDSSFTAALHKLGVRDAFTPQADFTRMASIEGAYFDEMTQMLKLIVNERGTEASVFTQATITLGGGSSSPFEMVVNRPFIVVIRDDQSGAILLIGIVRNPTRDTTSTAKAEQELTLKIKELETSTAAKSPDDDSSLTLRYKLWEARDYFFERSDFEKAKEYSSKLIAFGREPGNSSNKDPLSNHFYRQAEIELKLGDNKSALASINQLLDLYFLEYSDPDKFSFKNGLLDWETLLDDADKQFVALHQNRDRILSAKESLLKEIILEKADWKDRHFGAWRRELTAIGIPDSSASIDFEQFMVRYKHDLDVLAKDTRAMQAVEKDEKAFLDWSPTLRPDLTLNSFEELGPKQSKLAHIYIETKQPEKADQLLELSILNLIEDKSSESVVPNVVSLIEVLKVLGRTNEANKLSETLSHCESTCNAYLALHKEWVKLREEQYKRDLEESARQDREDAQRERKHAK